MRRWTSGQTAGEKGKNSCRHHNRTQRRIAVRIVTKRRLLHIFAYCCHLGHALLLLGLGLNGKWREKCRRNDGIGCGAVTHDSSKAQSRGELSAFVSLSP